MIFEDKKVGIRVRFRIFYLKIFLFLLFVKKVGKDYGGKLVFFVEQFYRWVIINREGEGGLK